MDSLGGLMDKTKEVHSPSNENENCKEDKEEMKREDLMVQYISLLLSYEFYFFVVVGWLFLFFVAVGKTTHVEKHNSKIVELSSISLAV